MKKDNLSRHKFETTILNRFLVSVVYEKQNIYSLQLSFAQSGREEVEIPVPLCQLIQELKEYLLGERKQFSSFALAYDDFPEFSSTLYDFLRKIPYGKVLKYGEVAQALGDVNLSRAVGICLGKNPIMILIPCHRIVGEKKLGGFSSPDGILMKDYLLRLEGAIL